MARLRQFFRDALAENKRVFAGFDFPFGYPAGATEAIAGSADWRALWSYFAEPLRTAITTPTTASRSPTGSTATGWRTRRVLGPAGASRTSRPVADEARSLSDGAFRTPHRRAPGDAGAAGVEARLQRRRRRPGADRHRAPRASAAATPTAAAGSRSGRSRPGFAQTARCADRACRDLSGPVAVEQGDRSCLDEAQVQAVRRALRRGSIGKPAEATCSRRPPTFRRSRPGRC